MQPRPRRRWSAAPSASSARASSRSSMSEREWRRRSSEGPWRPKTSSRRRSVGEPTVGDPLAAVAAKAPLDELELRAELVGVRVVVGPEPLPDRGQPPPVRLARVRSRGRSTSATAGSASTSVVDMPHDAASSRTSRAQQLAHEAAPRSTASRTVAGPTFGFPSRSPPIQLPKRSGDPGKPLLPGGEQGARRVPERVLDEPEPLSDLVHDAGPVGADLVRLPEDRDLLGKLGRRRVRRSLGVEPRVVERLQQPFEPPVLLEDRARKRLGRVRGEDELDRHPRGRSLRAPRRRPRPRRAARAPRPATRASVPPSRSTSRRRRTR